MCWLGLVLEPVDKRVRAHESSCDVNMCAVLVIVCAASFNTMFAGNIDDCFRLGVSVKRNSITLYAKFYSADMIIASPLGLRTIIGAKGLINIVVRHKD